MKLTRYCIREARMTWLLLALAVGGGVFAFLRLPTTEDPPFVFRFAAVTVTLPGAGAAAVDRLVAAPLESAILEHPEIEFTEVISRDDGMVMIVKLEDRIRETAPVWDRVEAKLVQLAKILPEGAGSPELDRELGLIYGVLIGITASEDLTREELEADAEALRADLAALPEVGRARLFGMSRKEVSVNLDMEAIALSGVPLWQVPEAIARNLIRLPGGGLSDQLPILASGAGPGLDYLGSIPIPLRDEDAMLELADIASIVIQPVPEAGETIRISGRSGLLLGVSMRERTRVEDLGEALRRLIESRESHPENRLRVEWIADEPTRVAERRNGLLLNLGQSLVVVCSMLVLTLGWREGAVVALLIPVAFLLSMIVMHLAGLGINHVALGGFIVVLGMLVDNNIVVAERIIRHRSEGMDGATAAIVAATELHRPLIVSALTTIAAFLPVFLAKSAAGEYTRPLFLVVAIALLSAELIVFTVTPVVSCRFFSSARWLGRKPGNRGRHPRYRKVLAWALEHRSVVLALMVVVVAFSIWGFNRIPVRFFPPSERPLLMIELEGGSAEAAPALEMAALLDELLVVMRAEESALNGWAVFSGRNAPRFVLNHWQREASPELVAALLRMDSADDLEAVATALHERLKPHFPGYSCRVFPLEVGPAIGAPVQMRLKGDSPVGLAEAAQRLQEMLEGDAKVVESGLNWGMQRAGYRLWWDEGRAAEVGLGRSERAALLQAVLRGLPVGVLEIEESMLPVLVNVPGPGEGESPADLLLPDPRGGEPFRLGDLAAIEEALVFPRIDRHSGRQAITVWAEPATGVTPTEVESLVEAWQLGGHLPGPGIALEFWGEALQAEIANRSLLREVPWAVLCIVTLLVFQLKSWRSSLIVMMTVPLGFTGAIGGLLLTGEELTFMTLIGLISLSGIVVNGAILLLDRIRLNRESGMDAVSSLLDAGEQRFRAIILTASTTVCGLLPLVFFGGAFWRPMAVAIISGLILATALILLVVPVLHSTLFPGPSKTSQ